jgi:3-oxoacyl-[acyl-carrier protein] reductase
MSKPAPHTPGADATDATDAGDATDAASPGAHRTLRRVVVSGGGTGIGRAIAARFAQQGAKVTIIGRRPDVLSRTAEELAGLPGQVTAQPLDLTEATAVADHLDAIDDGPGVDIVVNAAGGIAEGDDTTLDGIAQGWQDMLAGNLLSAVLLTEALRPRLRPGGRVISIGSIAGSTGAGSYGAAKAALIAWNATLAGQLAPSGATANVIAPGYVTETGFFGDRMTTERHERLVDRTLLGRAGKPDDVAGAVAFLASEDAAWITGQVLHVNGGALLAR